MAAHLRFVPHPQDSDPSDTLYKIETVPRPPTDPLPSASGAVWEHLSSPETVAAVPWQYHVSVCKGFELFSDDWAEVEARWSRLKALAARVDNHRVIIRIDDVAWNWCAHVGQGTPILGDAQNWEDILFFRNLGWLHKGDKVTISM